MRSGLCYNVSMVRMSRPALRALFMLALVAACLGALPAAGRADTAAELQQKIDAQNKSIRDLEAEIASFQTQLVAVSKNKDTLANAVAQLNLESKQLAAQIKVTEGKISAANLRLQSLGESIQKTDISIGELEAAVAKSLRDMRIEDTDSLSSLLVGGATLTEVWQHAAEREALRDALREKTGELSVTKDVLVTDQTQVEKTKHDLIALDDRLRDQKTINQKTQNQKNVLLKETKSQESAYQKLIAQKQALKAQLETDLRDYESKLKYALDPSTLPAAGSAPLAWPVDNVRITQLFGRTSDSGRLYASGSHNGVDFGIPIGTPVKAMAAGTVVGYGNTDNTCPKASYGLWVYIKYDNGLSSVYGHLSLVKPGIAAGTRVRAGDVIGYSGETGYATGPHLHLTVIAASAGSIQSFPSKACSGRTYTAPVAATNAYLDPMLYLPKQ